MQRNCWLKTQPEILTILIYPHIRYHIHDIESMQHNTRNEMHVAHVAEEHSYSSNNSSIIYPKHLAVHSVEAKVKSHQVRKMLDL